MFLKKYINLIILLCKIFFVLFFAVFMIIYPQVVFNAALRGLDTWWRIVFPALLPFFVVSDILIGLGLVHFLGDLLEPIMRPLFNLPGSSAFVLAMGYTSGAPIGAVLTGKIRRQNLCTKTEATRLMAFTNNASPLFIFGAIAVGMFDRPALGAIIASAHYLANICVGLILRFYGAKHQQSLSFRVHKQAGLLAKATRSLYRAYITDGRPLGKLLGDAIKSSIQTLLAIGGFIIIFSVIIEILSTIGLLTLLAKGLSFLLSSLQLDKNLHHALSCGIIEMTIGIKLTSETVAPLKEQLIVISIILGWLGLSVHAQAISMVADTDIDIRPYLFGRILHSIFAGILVTILIRFQNLAFVFRMPNPLLWKNPWLHSLHCLRFTLILLCIMTLLSLLLYLLSQLNYLRKYYFSQTYLKK